MTTEYAIIRRRYIPTVVVGQRAPGRDRPVVTYQAPSGAAIRVCDECARIMERAEAWPRNYRGEEFCTISEGRHLSRCDICQSYHEEEQPC